MTVAELIKALQSKPQDAVVVCNIREDGGFVEEVSIVHPSNVYWMGDSPVSSEDNAVLIGDGHDTFYKNEPPYYKVVGEV